MGRAQAEGGRRRFEGFVDRLSRALHHADRKEPLRLYLTGLLLPGMVERRRGGILNVASTAAFQPGPGMAVYYATKAYVLSFSEALAEELAGTGVTVTAVCPGPTATNFGAAANMHPLGLVNKISMSAEAVAVLGHRAYRCGRVVAVTGLRNQILAFLTRLGPRAAVRKITKRLNGVQHD